MGYCIRKTYGYHGQQETVTAVRMQATIVALLPGSSSVPMNLFRDRMLSLRAPKPGREEINLKETLCVRS